MGRSSWPLRGLVTLSSIAATRCGGTVAVGASGTSGGGQTGGASSGTMSSTGAASSSGCSTATPSTHRAQQVPCPPSHTTSGPYPSCTTDADCKISSGFGALLMGKCTTTSTGQACDFNACVTDASCADPTNVCTCQGQSGGNGMFGSVCLPAKCHVDADCGQAGYCSLSHTPGCGYIAAWDCHTCADACVNDTDCPMTGDTCAFDAALGHWACSFAVCSG